MPVFRRVDQAYKKSAKNQLKFNNKMLINPLILSKFDDIQIPEFRIFTTLF